MYENKCAICGQPILGYWYEVGKNNVCQSCAASTTVYDLFQRDIIDIKPDIVDGEATLVTKDGEEVKAYMTAKSQLNSEYGMAAKSLHNSAYGEMDGDPYPFNDDGYHYTDEDIETARKIISGIKSLGLMSEREFFEECQKLRDAGANDTDNSLLILYKQYVDIMPTPRYEGDTGNDTWDAMYTLWQ